MLHIDCAGFDWDEGNRRKCQKHGVSLEEIESFFKLKTLYVAPDVKHSQSEQRFIAIGMSTKDKPLFIAFTLRMKEGRSLIRPISSRYMHKREWKKYEQEITRNEN